jgi:hypothetical protein
MIAVKMEIQALIEMVFCVASGLPSCVAKITARATRQDTATMQLSTSKTQRSSHRSRMFLHLWNRDTATRVLSDSLDAAVAMVVTPANFSLSGLSELVRGEIFTAISESILIVNTSFNFRGHYSLYDMSNW